MENNEIEKRKVGRPRSENLFPTEWENIIIDAGRKGLHITQFLFELGITLETHSQLLKRNKRYSDAVDRYKILCENYWYNQMHEQMKENGGAGYNSRLWSLIMRNKFGDRWSESSKVDVTSQGNQLQTNPIQIEIIRKSINENTQEITETDGEV
jgi:hypothetical protein